MTSTFVASLTQGWKVGERGDTMEMTEEVRKVLDVVRQVLRERTRDWVNEGQDLITGIEARVRKA